MSTGGLSTERKWLCSWATKMTDPGGHLENYLACKSAPPGGLALPLAALGGTWLALWAPRELSGSRFGRPETHLAFHLASLRLPTKLSGARFGRPGLATQGAIWLALQSPRQLSEKNWSAQGIAPAWSPNKLAPRAAEDRAR